MAKFGIGESVYFRDSEISVSVIPCMSVTIKTDNLSGKVTGVVNCVKEETEYHVGVNMPAKGVVLNVKVKESALLSCSEYVQKVIDDLMNKAKGIRTKILRTDNPDPYGWLNGFLNPTTAKELSERMASICKAVNHSRYVLGIDLGHYFSKIPEKKDEDKKMSKSRCVKLLESYRAERDKVKKGRKFERCLRDSVVDEALERAIELLKE